MIYRPLERELFNRLFDYDNRACGKTAEAPKHEARTDWTPAVDIQEESNAFRLQFDLPGLKQEEIDIELKGEVLTIKGERTQAQEEKREGYLRTERVWGKFQRSFTFRTPVEGDKVTATYRNGVLEVLVPKTEEVQPKKIVVANE